MGVLLRGARDPVSRRVPPAGPNSPVQTTLRPWNDTLRPETAERRLERARTQQRPQAFVKQQSETPDRTEKHEYACTLLKINIKTTLKNCAKGSSPTSSTSAQDTYMETFLHARFFEAKILCSKFSKKKKKKSQNDVSLQSH